MKKDIKRFLAAAVCIASMGTTVNSAFSAQTTVSIGSDVSGIATGGNGTLTLIGSGVYMWTRSNVTSAIAQLTGGELIVEGYGIDDKINGTLKAQSGDLYLDGGVLTLKENSSIDWAVNTNIKNGTTLSILGGTARIDGVGDFWNGTITIDRGDLQLNNATKATSGIFNQTGGQTSIVGTNAFNMNNAADSVTGGTLNIGSGNIADRGRLNVSKGNISTDANVNIESWGEINVNGGNVTIDRDDKWDGYVYLTDGTLNVNNNQKNGSFEQAGGTLNVSGKNFDLNNENDLIDGGTVNVGNGSVAATLGVSKGTIDAGAVVNINDRGTLNVNGGDVTLDKDDKWAGNVNVSGNGELALVGISKTGTLTQSSGVTTITGSGFDLNNENDYISGGFLNVGNDVNRTNVSVSKGAVSHQAIVHLYDKSMLNVTGGSVALDSGDTWDGDINMSSGDLDLDSISKNMNATFIQTGGTTTVIGNGLDLNNADDSISGGKLNLGNNNSTATVNVSQGSISSDTSVRINSNSALNLHGGSVSLDSTDTWQGHVNVSDGTLNIDGTNKHSGGKLSQSGGTTNITGSGFNFNNKDDEIKGGTVNIGNGSTKTDVEVSQGVIYQDATLNLAANAAVEVSGGSVFIDNSDTWNGDVNVSGGSLALVGVNNKNGTLTQNGGSTTVMGKGLDLNKETDKITGGLLDIGGSAGETDITVSKGTISSNADVNLKKNSTMNISGGNVSFDKSDIWNGSVAMTDGTFNADNISKDAGGKFAQSGGTTNVTGTGFDMNNDEDCVSGGSLNIGDGTIASDMSVSKGVITEGAAVNITTNSKLNISGGKVAIDNADKWDGNVNISGGSLALVGVNKNSSAAYTQSGGATTVTGTSFNLNNSSDKVSGGTFNIGDGSDEPASVEVSRGTIEKGASVNVMLGNTMNITGGDVSLDGATDTLDGSVNVVGGNLALDSMSKNSDGIFNQTGGTTTITGTGTTFNNEKDTVANGNLNIGTPTASGELNIAKGSIEKEASVNIDTKGTLNVKGGTVDIDGGNDKWNGSISVSDGTLNITDGVNKSTNANGKFNQIGGTTNIDNSKVALNTEESKITGGTVNLTNNATLDINNSSNNSAITNSTGAKLSIRRGKHTITGGTVDSASSVNVAADATLQLGGENANVTVDGNNDTMRGHVRLSKGTLNFTSGASKSTSSNGTFNQTDGKLNLNGESTLALTESESKISGGEVNVSESASLVVSNGNKNTSVLNSTSGNLTLSNNSTYTSKSGIIDSASSVRVNSGSKLELDGESSEVSLDGRNDTIDGSLALKKGNLYISDDLTKVTDENGNYVQTGGKLTLSSSNLTIDDNTSSISGGDVALTNNSTLTFTDKSTTPMTGGNVVIDDTSVLNYLATKGLIKYSGDNSVNIDTSGLINMVNSVRTNYALDTLTVNNGGFGDGTADFHIDIAPRNGGPEKSDTISANSIKTASVGEGGTINISDWNFVGDALGDGAPIDKQIRLGRVFNSDDIAEEITFTATDKEIFTPIGYYRLNASDANDGTYTLDLTRFNPQVYRGQVATLAQYMNQLTVNDTLFNHAQLHHYARSYGEEFKNKTAILDGNADYERTIRDGSLWYDMYGNFESIKTKSGLKYDNNAWGFMVGADFGLKKLKSGWDYIPTVYISYNGANQKYNSTKMTENGAQIGFMSSWMKNKFVETALAYVGLYGTDMDVGARSDDDFNYFFGLASRSTYDMKLGQHFRLQPGVTLAYSMFGKQSWNSDYGNMKMTSGMLNGFNIAPGVNLIWEKESWSMYATLAYVYNINTGIDGTAGNIDLSEMELKTGYLQYGFGLSKTLTERFRMYAQATIRNMGRNGIVCQGGFNWRF